MRTPNSFVLSVLREKRQLSVVKEVGVCGLTVAGLVRENVATSQRDTA
jgi:hypothetical protein